MILVRQPCYAASMATTIPKNGRMDGVRTRHVWRNDTIHDIAEIDHDGRVLSREVVEVRFEDESVGYIDDMGIARYLVEVTQAMVFNRLQDGER